MNFNLAVIGELPDNQRLYDQINELIRLIETSVFGGGDPSINVLISPEYTGERWKPFVGNRYPLHGYALAADEDKISGCARSVCIESQVRSVIGEKLCDQSDLLLGVWNESVTEMRSATWELMRQAQLMKIPFIWISSKNPDKIYWARESFFEPYSPDRLKELGENLSADIISAAAPEKRKRSLLSVGERLHSRFLNRHKARWSEIPAQKDVLLRGDFTDKDEKSESSRRGLLEQFERFDKAAVDNASRYHAVMYWRAILPLIATVFLGLGFYADPVLSFIPGAVTLDVIIGVSFLIHGLLNLYVFLLSRDSSVKKWQRHFLNNRYIAEMLRVLIHFTPYGISLDLRKLSGGDKRIHATIRAIVKENENDAVHINKSDAHEILSHVTEMVEDQINYHRLSAQRYKNIVDRLKKWHSVIFKIGFVSVLLRALLQFALIFENKIMSNPLALSAGTYSVIKSYANMFAMMLPAWGSYFLSKLGQCGYEYNYQNHKQMEASLSQELKRLQSAKNLGSSVLLESLEAIAERISEIMLVADTGMWHSKMKASKVTLL